MPKPPAGKSKKWEKSGGEFGFFLALPVAPIKLALPAVFSTALGFPFRYFSFFRNQALTGSSYNFKLA